jgi:citrate lyase subunit beta / citryl-CoA lyase
MLNSYLYVPGDRPDLLAKAENTAVHALILDLEDSVAPAARMDAAGNIAQYLTERTRSIGERVAAGRSAGKSEVVDGLGTAQNKVTLLRVHPEHLAEHIRLAVEGGVDAICLPKADLASLTSCVDLLAGTEADLGTVVPLAVSTLVESAQGLLDAPEMARHDRVQTMALGEADLFADLGMNPNLADSARIGVRTPLVLACAAAGIVGPTAPVSTNFRDIDALRASCVELKQLGYRARSAIHPAQVAVINELFAPTAEELEAARKLVETFDAAVAAGLGVMLDDDGRMVDEAVVRSARRLLD